jgi:hypothetical protein
MMNIRIEVELDSKERVPLDAASALRESVERTAGIRVVARAHFVIEEEGVQEPLHLYPFRVLKKGDLEYITVGLGKGAPPLPEIVFGGEAKSRLYEFIRQETARLLNKIN